MADDMPELPRNESDPWHLRMRRWIREGGLRRIPIEDVETVFCDFLDQHAQALHLAEVAGTSLKEAQQANASMQAFLDRLTPVAVEGEPEYPGPATH